MHCVNKRSECGFEFVSVDNQVGEQNVLLEQSGVMPFVIIFMKLLSCYLYYTQMLGLYLYVLNH